MNGLDILASWRFSPAKPLAATMRGWKKPRFHTLPKRTPAIDGRNLGSGYVTAFLGCLGNGGTGSPGAGGASDVAPPSIVVMLSIIDFIVQPDLST